MSNRQVREAKLQLLGAEWVGPLFTPEVRALQGRVGALGRSLKLEELDGATRIPGTFANPNPRSATTSDGYQWYWCRRFMMPEFRHHGCVVLLVPHCNDSAREDETLTDRSVAAYYLGNVTLCEVDGVARRFKMNLPEPTHAHAH